MASVKSMLAAGLLAAPCADAFVAPGVSQVQVQGATLRGSAGVQSESSFGPKSALAAASAGAVALSFIGAQRPVARKQKVVCNFSKESQIGAMDPLGYFDPLDLCKDEATFKDFRAKEIKHGRLVSVQLEKRVHLVNEYNAHAAQQHHRIALPASLDDELVCSQCGYAEPGGWRRLSFFRKRTCPMAP